MKLYQFIEVIYNGGVRQIIKNLLKPGRIRQITDARNVGLYIFAVVVLAIAWSGAKAVQKNYELQKQISLLQQQNDILHLTNQNTYLRNQYYETNQFLELSARRNFGLAAPGETVLLVPKSEALKYVDESLRNQANAPADLEDTDKSPFAANLDDWRDFLLGRKLFED